MRIVDVVGRRAQICAIRQHAVHRQAHGVELLAGGHKGNDERFLHGVRTHRGRPEVERLRDLHGWFLPYSPGAGCVRSFAFHGSRIYAAVEVGGVLRSDDLGATWRLVEGSTGNPDFNTPVPRTFLHPDVHEVAVLSASEDVVLAATMLGLYRSLDGGKKWLHLYADCYIRSLWIDPADHQHLIIGPADDVEINGQIEESNNAGWSWHTISAGLPVPWRRAVVERLTPVGAELFAVVSNGQLFAAPIETLEWRRILSDVADVAAITAWAPDNQSRDDVRPAAELCA